MINDLRWKTDPQPRRKYAKTEEDDRSLIQARLWLEDLEGVIQKAKQELTVKKSPGRAMSELVGMTARISYEDWWAHWYR